MVEVREVGGQGERCWGGWAPAAQGVPGAGWEVGGQLGLCRRRSPCSGGSDPWDRLPLRLFPAQPRAQPGQGSLGVPTDHTSGLGEGLRASRSAQKHN